MLTRLRVSNFKRFGELDVELGESVVFIGPNNSGKSTALQALSLWNIGLRQWNAKRGGKASPEKRPGVTINRRDLISIPVPATNLLWQGLHTREGKGKNSEGKTQTSNIRIAITVDGVTEGRMWTCGFEFDYSNEESIVCRPLRLPEYENKPVKGAKFPQLPDDASSVSVALLPPMSGLAGQEFLKQPGEVDFLVGQGRTAEVLRNLCYRVYQDADKTKWAAITERIRSLFGVELCEPEYLPDISEITMKYRESGIGLDLSSSGRGLQQTLLLLAHLYANPSTVLLLDEPDAHLEILRQRQTYELLTEVAEEQESQIIAASHSEIVLNEAADRDIVIAFVGKPHRINDRGSQLAKALKEIGFDQYYQAEETGWVLYLEGSTDLKILQAFARKLDHPAREYLERPFTHTVGNQPGRVRDHFNGLREAKRDLVGIAIFDSLERPLPDDLGARGLTWRRKEIENYLCAPEVLLAYVKDEAGGTLFSANWTEKMEAIIKDVVPPAALRDPNYTWWSTVKATDDFLDPVFERFYGEVNLPVNLMRKSNYHVLAKYVPKNAIDLEVTEKLDAIAEVAQRAKPCHSSPE